MKQQTKQTQTLPNRPASKSGAIYMVGGIILLLAAGGFYWYYRKQKQQQKGSLDQSSDSILDIPTYQTPPIVATTSTSSSSQQAGYTIKQGSRHPDVFVLQRYLKSKGAYLGSSGKNKDGVDGIFGTLTQKAAQQITKKTVFTQADITRFKNS